MPISYMSYVSVKIKICHDIDCLMRQLPVVCPPHPHVVISICWTNVHSYLNNFAPWKWQVRRWSTAGLRGVLLRPHALPVFLNPPTSTNPPDIIVSSRVSIHLDTLPKLNPPNPAGKTFSYHPRSQLPPKIIFSLPLLTLE